MAGIVQHAAAASQRSRTWQHSCMSARPFLAGPQSLPSACLAPQTATCHCRPPRRLPATTRKPTLEQRAMGRQTIRRRCRWAGQRGRGEGWLSMPNQSMVDTTGGRAGGRYSVRAANLRPDSAQRSSSHAGRRGSSQCGAGHNPAGTTQLPPHCLNLHLQPVVYSLPHLQAAVAAANAEPGIIQLAPSSCHLTA